MGNNAVNSPGPTTGQSINLGNTGGFSRVEIPNVQKPTSDAKPLTIDPNKQFIPTQVTQDRLIPTKKKSLAEGIGKISSTINEQTSKIQKKVNDVYYGKPNAGQDSNKKFFQKALDKGLINILNAFASIDLCNIIMYAINKIPSTKPFDPDLSKNDTKTTFGLAKYRIQKLAYDIQTYIDDFYNSYGESKTPASVLGLNNLMEKITQALGVFNDQEAQAVINEVKGVAPEITVLNNFLTNTLGIFNRNLGLRDIPVKEFQYLISIVDKTRATCVAIQSINSASGLIQFADTVVGGEIGRQIQELNKLMDPKKIQSVIKSIINVVKALQSACNFLLSVINIGRTAIRICIVVLKVLSIISQFMTKLGIPNLYTIVGITTTVAAANEKIQRTIKELLDRLDEINTSFEIMYYLIKDISIKLENIINVLRVIIANLEACINLDPSIVPELKAATDSLQATKDALDKFVKDYDDNKNRQNTNFQGYTIEIITEELTDEGITLKRRYGVALDNKRQVAVQSTPTFASDDQIIIQEVKLLLSSKGLVDLQVASTRELNIIEESSNYLADVDLEISDIENNPFEDELDDSENENDSDGLGLNAFVNKLKGGKRLRNRMRRIMAKQRRELADSLQTADPRNSITQNLSKKQRKSAISDEIKSFQEEIKLLTEENKELQPLSIIRPELRAKIITNTQKINRAKNKIIELNKEVSNIK